MRRTNKLFVSTNLTDYFTNKCWMKQTTDVTMYSTDATEKVLRKTNRKENDDSWNCENKSNGTHRIRFSFDSFMVALSIGHSGFNQFDGSFNELFSTPHWGDNFCQTSTVSLCVSHSIADLIDFHLQEYRSEYSSPSIFLSDKQFQIDKEERCSAVWIAMLSRSTVFCLWISASKSAIYFRYRNLCVQSNWKAVS